MRASRMLAATSILAITLVASLGLGSVAYADDVSGTIKAVDKASHKITLDSGKAYIAGPKTDLSNYKPGEKVKITYTPALAIWQSLGIAGDASSITAQ